MAIQPIDTWCLQDQAAQKRSQFRAAYVGAGANGFRQFKTWMAFSYTEAYFSRYFRENTTINPSSPCGIMVNAFPVGFSVTILCHADHRLKNHLQINNQTTVSAKKNRESRYVRAFKEIIQEQGVRGLFRGLASKGFSNVVLAGGALFLLNKGRIKNKEENSGKK